MTVMVRSGRRCRIFRPCAGLEVSSYSSQASWGWGVHILSEMTCRAARLWLGHRVVCLRLAGGMGFLSRPWPPPKTKGQ
jgi:hypothetical protein